jgi:hypothetical protein
LNLLFDLALAAPCAQLAGTIQHLPLPLALLDGMDGVIIGDLLDRIVTTDRLQCNFGLEVGAVGAALAHWWEPLLGAVARFRF